MSRTPKVAFISAMAGAPWGGSEELWSLAALRMKQQGMDVFVNVSRWREIPERLKVLQQEGCQLTRRPLGFSFKDQLLEKIVGRSAYRWLDEIRPDLVVISQGSNTGDYPWMEECSRRKIRFVTLSNCAASDFWPSDAEVARAVQVYREALACYFVCKANLELTELQLATPLRNAKIVRNPFLVSYDANPEWPRNGSTKQLACLARMEPKAKGQDLLLEVLRQDKWRRRPIEVTLFGEGRNAESLKALCKMYRIEQVHFGGFVTDIESVWASHHALILPSRFEGLPLVIVEAMLCHRPCIVTDVGGNTELVEDNQTGFIAMAPKTDCIDEAMERAWQRREDWQLIGRRAGERVRELVPPDPVGEFVKELEAFL